MTESRYLHDLKALDGVWDLTRAITRRTVAIVIGGSVLAELLDRPGAVHLRGAIEKRVISPPVDAASS